MAGPPQDLAVVELTIDGLAIGGRGVARRQGMVWLVEGALPGDVVEAAVRRAHPRWIEARALRVLRPSPQRREAVCLIQAECGGCAWMTLHDDAQRDWKRRLLVDALERVGRIESPPVEPTVHAPPTLAYRNKIELSFGVGPDGRAVLGYHPPGDALHVQDVVRCAVADERIGGVLAVAREVLLDGPSPPGPPARLIVRSSKSTGQVLVAFRAPPGPLPDLERFARIVRERVPEVASVVRIEAREDRRGGGRTIAVSGPPSIEERIAGISFQLPAAAFCQIHPGVAERLVAVVEEVADLRAGASVLELYGGIGLLSIALARRGACALVCDADPDAIESGRRAALDAGNLSVRYERADAGRFLERVARQEGRPPDLVLADPPRAGLGRSIARSLGQLRAPRIVLVSCDPATLARDVREIAACGYRLERAVPLDMFPQTPHVESVALLRRA